MTKISWFFLACSETALSVALTPRSGCLQARKKFEFLRMHFFAGRLACEKLRAVNFGKLLLLARVWRPLRRKRVAVNRRWIAVTFESPHRHDFAAFPLDAAEGEKRSRRPQPDFLFEFTLGRGKLGFPVLYFAFGQKPGPFILLCPERPARMDQQDFQGPIADSIHR